MSGAERRTERAGNGGAGGQPSWLMVEGAVMAAGRAIRRTYDRHLAELGLHLSACAIIGHLVDHGSLTQAELAERVGTGRANVGLLINDLEGRGLLRRTADPTDRRVWRIELTDPGHDTWARIVNIDREVRRRLRVGTTAAERRQLESLLGRIITNAADDLPAPR